MGKLYIRLKIWRGFDWLRNAIKILPPLTFKIKISFLIE